MQFKGEKNFCVGLRTQDQEKNSFPVSRLMGRRYQGIVSLETVDVAISTKIQIPGKGCASIQGRFSENPRRKNYQVKFALIPRDVFQRKSTSRKSIPMKGTLYRAPHQKIHQNPPAKNVARILGRNREIWKIFTAKRVTFSKTDAMRSTTRRIDSLLTKRIFAVIGTSVLE